MSNIGVRADRGLFGIGGTSAVERAARILVAAHRSEGNLLVCGSEADRVTSTLKQVGLDRVLTMEPGAVSVFGQPGDVLILASQSTEPTSLMYVASKARNAGLRRIGFLPGSGDGEHERILEITLGFELLRDISQTLHRLLRPEETIILALSDAGGPSYGSEWAVRSLRSRGLNVVDISAAEVSEWDTFIVGLRRSAEIIGADLTETRVVSDMQGVLDAAAAVGATPQPVTAGTAAAVVARRILMEYAATEDTAEDRGREPRAARSTYK